MTDVPENPEEQTPAPQADPWRSFGAVMAGVISTKEKRTVDVGELIAETATAAA